MSIFISLGSNLGKREENLLSVVRIFENYGLLIKKSSVYETKPWGYKAQDDFLNQVVEVDVNLDPFELLKFLKSIEVLIGRKPTIRYGPRVIDLDILFYHNLIINAEVLTIPHPRIPERGFVLVPLTEIAPEFIHPVLGVSMKTLLKKVDISEVRKIASVS